MLAVLAISASPSIAAGAFSNNHAGNQARTLAVRMVGGNTFTTVATADCQPLASDAGGTTKVTLCDSNISGIDAPEVTANPPLRIMCMGDSITAGYTNNPTWTHPFRFGYRRGLHSLLTQAGYRFLFVGASAEPWNNAFGDPTLGGTCKPDPDLRDIGQDGHRGYGAQSARFLNGNIVNWLNADNPDVILLKIGTNSQNTSDLNTLVGNIFATKPDVRLIIAQIMPKNSYQEVIVTYNTYIRDTLVPAYQAQGRRITTVDQYTPFLTNPADLTSIDPSLFSNGINHPSNAGYDKMARVWFDEMQALGLGPNPPANE